MSTPDNLITRLNPEQHSAVTAGTGPLLIVAGAGTGKTAVITTRIAWLIREGLAAPNEILALTFTEKAAEEMEERVDRLLPYGYSELWIQTFHAFAQKVLETHALEIGLPTPLKLFDATSSWRVVRENIEKFNLNYWRPAGNPTKFIHALISHWSRAKDELITPAQYLEYAEKVALSGDSTQILSEEAKKLKELANAYHIYEELLLEQGATDFGGLINSALLLFQKRPNILDLYRKRFKYILVDEFQDTNIAQYELVKLLLGPDQNLTVVGDDDQSIYKFRGASISNILEFKRDFPHSKEIYLTTNYRSRQNILDLAYTFIQQNNPYRLEVQLGGSRALSKKLVAANSGEGRIEHLHGEDAHEEARLVKEKILELKTANPDTTWNDFAILVRANDHAKLFIRALADAGIPYEFVASRGLYLKPVILDVLAYLRLLDDYHENTAAYRVLNFSSWRLGTEEVIKLLYWANRRALSLYEAARRSALFGVFGEDTIKTFNIILAQIEKHRELARRESVSKVLLSFLHDTGYLASLTKENDSGVQALRYLNQFWKMINEFEGAQTEPTVKNFLARINLELEAGEEGALTQNPDDGPEAVKVLTVHAAKGLEFSFVFLVNMVDRRFPTLERKEPIELPMELVKEILPEGDAHLQEERRLFYVGCTRAKEGLFFTSASDYGGTRNKKLSRFLVELGFKQPSSKFTESILPGENKNKLEEVKEAHPLLPSKFSFTQLKAFESCPLQYKFAHILKIPVRGRHTFSFGQTIHAALQKFLELVRQACGAQASLFGEKQEAAFPSVDTLLGIYNNCWQDDWYGSKAEKEEYYERGAKLLKRMYHEFENERPTPIALELPFTVKIGNTIFKGKIDRVDIMNNGGVHIIDYKTGTPKNEKTVDKDQLFIYQIAAEEVLYPQRVIPGKPAMLTFYYVEDGSRISFLGKPEELEKFKKRIEATIAELHASTFAASPSSQVCRFCDFKDICEFREL